MSFTKGENVFAGVNERGINSLLTAFFTARPHYLNYGTPHFAPTTTVNVTSIPPVSIPGILSGIEFAISFQIPTVDINPDSSGGTSPLPPGTGKFTIKTQVTISLLCVSRGENMHDVRQRGTVLTTSLGVFALCAPFVINSAPGTGEIGIRLERAELVDITPDALESIVECLIENILQSVLSNVHLPFNTLTLGAFGLILKAGPDAEEDQVKVRGDIL